MLCHLAEFVSAGGRFMGRGCHAAGSGRAKADWLPTNNQSDDPNQAPPVFCSTSHNDMSATDKTRMKRGSCANNICHWEEIGVSAPACESMEFPCPPAPDSQVNTGGTSSAKKYVTASCVASGTTINSLPGAASARNCSTSVAGVILSSAPATKSAVTGRRASSVVVSSSPAGISKTDGNFFKPALTNVFGIHLAYSWQRFRTALDNPA